MGIYIILLILTLLGLCIKNKYRKTYGLFLLVIMAIISGLRDYNVGTDTLNYLDRYAKSYDNINFEYSFSGIVIFLNYIGCPPWTIQFFFSTLTFIVWGIVLKQRSNNIVVSILVLLVTSNLYFFETMNLVRQSCAVPFILMSIFSIQDKDYWKGFIYFFIALGFHTSTLLILPILVTAYNYTMPVKLYRLIIIVSLCIGISISSISQISNIFLLLNQIDAMSLSHYASYAVYRINDNKSIIGILSMTLTSAIVAFLAYKHLNKILIVKAFCYAVIINNIVGIMPTGQRYLYGLVAIEVLLYPVLYNYSKKYKIVMILMLSFLLALTFIKRLPVNPNPENEWFVPYHSIIGF